MNRMFILALRSEWLKRRRSLGAWLVVLGALFTPTVVVTVRLWHHDGLDTLYRSNDFWTGLWHSSWESMAIFFLPLMAILATSLVTQIEYRNHAWKQVHALPLSLATIFFAKLAVIVVMLLQFLLLFDAGIYLSAILPWLLLDNVPYPPSALPLLPFLQDTAGYFLDCLPILGLQYLLSLRFRSFLAPIGFGFLAWIGSLAALSWRGVYFVPYAYSMLDYLGGRSPPRVPVAPVDPHLLALGFFVASIAIALVVFARQPQKG